jgi:putative flippase GtrA
MTLQFLRYGAAGAVGTAIHYATLIALVQLARVPVVAASTAGAIAGAVVNYLVNHRWTFTRTRNHAQSVPRFAAVALAGLVMNATVIAVLMNAASAHYLVVQFTATGVVLIAGYFANRAWTF